MWNFLDRIYRSYNKPREDAALALLNAVSNVKRPTMTVVIHAQMMDDSGDIRLRLNNGSEWRVSLTLLSE